MLQKEAKEAKREAREDIEKGAESEPEDVSALGHEELQGYDREYKQLKVGLHPLPTVMTL